MPLYEYYCSNCKSKFELLVGHQHADDVVCMKCHSEKVRRLLSTFSLPRGGSENSDFDDAVPAMGSCGCGEGGCGCH
ncbi:MAG TPA: zinc ribbon domain-containing protein [Ktedonobacteraceae bacterium]|nr:zinc ribbon domain-containing protein [Ktedonobacteraceae bacterium]